MKRSCGLELEEPGGDVAGHAVDLGLRPVGALGEHGRGLGLDGYDLDVRVLRL